MCANILVIATKETAAVGISDRPHCGAGPGHRLGTHDRGGGGGPGFVRAAQPVSQVAELRPAGSGHKG